MKIREKPQACETSERDKKNSFASLFDRSAVSTAKRERGKINENNDNSFLKYLY
jgi:hypothetical protein